METGTLDVREPVIDGSVVGSELDSEILGVAGGMNDDRAWERSREIDVERSGRAELGSSSENSWGGMVFEGSGEGAASFANVLGKGGHSRRCIPWL